MKIRTSEVGEQVIERIRVELGAPQEYKWRILRLALALSIRRDQAPVDPPRPATGGKEYDLKQLTGRGKVRDPSDPDITEALQAMLSVRHGRDYFGAAAEDDFVTALQFHAHRGLEEIRARLDNGENTWEILDRALPVRGDVRTVRSVRSAVVETAARSAGIRAAAVGAVERGPRWDRHVLRMEQGESPRRIALGIDKIAFSLGVPPERVSIHDRDAESVYVDVLRSRNDWTELQPTDLRSWVEGAPRHHLLPVCPGADVVGRPLWFDLEAAPHILVAGANRREVDTGLRGLLGSMVLSRGAQALECAIFDSPEGGLRCFDGLEHLRWPRRVIRHQPDVESALQDLGGELARRYRRLETRNIRNLAEARRRGERLPSVVIVLGDLSLAIASPESEAPLSDILKRGRAVGLHVILATSRAFGGAPTPTFLTQVTTRVAFSVRSAQDSGRLLGELGAESLPGDGECLVRVQSADPGAAQRVTSLPFSELDAAELVALTKEGT